MVNLLSIDEICNTDLDDGLIIKYVQLCQCKPTQHTSQYCQITHNSQLTALIIEWRRGVVVTSLVSINEVNLR